MIESIHRFTAMGSDCAFTITGPDRSTAAALATRAQAVVDHLESLWSRFRPDSELMRLNARAGSASGVGPDTYALIASAIGAWRLTGGLFDPTMLDALVAAGYDRSFDALGDAHRDGSVDGPSPTVRQNSLGPDAILLDEERAFVTLPEHVHLDLGGIAKGAAADTVAGVLERAGAIGACVDLGGDIAVFGSRCDGQPWVIGVDDPAHRGADLALLRLDRGAVATSSRSRRRWVRAGQDAHHLIDPRTGRPATSDLLSVTVVASTTMWAEVYAKSALIAGSIEGELLVRSAGLAALFVGDGGEVIAAGDIDRFLIPVVA